MSFMRTIFTAQFDRVRFSRGRAKRSPHCVNALLRSLADFALASVVNLCPRSVQTNRINLSAPPVRTNLFAIDNFSRHTRRWRPQLQTFNR
jgi:hypothetical protein